MRKGKTKGDEVYIFANFTPVDRKKYRIGVPRSGEYELVLSSAWEKYGGAVKTRKKTFKAKKSPVRDMPYSIEADLSGLSVIYLKRKPQVKKTKASAKSDGDKVRRENK